MRLTDATISHLTKRAVPRTLKLGLKHVVWTLLCRHENTSPPLFLFTSRRSGGTWLSETLARQPGVLFINEPTETGKYDWIALRQGLFPPNILEQLGIPVSNSDAEWLIQFFRDLSEGRVRVQQPWNPASKTFHFRTNRVAIKTHVTKPFLVEIAAAFPSSPMLWLVRHPLPQAHSAMRIGATITAPLYRRAAPVIAQLTPAQRQYCDSVLARGDRIECYLLDWALENLVPWHQRRADLPLTSITYETLVTNRQALLIRLADALEMPALRTAASHDQASASTRERAKAQLISRANQGDDEARRALVGGWLAGTSAADFDRCQRMLDTFEIDLYEARDALPRQGSS